MHMSLTRAGLPFVWRGSKLQTCAPCKPISLSPITQVRHFCMVSRSHLEKVCKCPHPEDSAHFHLAVKCLSYCSPSNALGTLDSDTHLLLPAPKGWIPSTSAKLERAPRAHLPLPQPKSQPRCDVAGFLQDKTVFWFLQPLATVLPALGSSRPGD